MKVDGEWKDCIIYQTLYNNPDGWVWVRDRKEFFDLFKAVSDKPEKVFSEEDIEFIDTDRIAIRDTTEDSLGIKANRICIRGNLDDLQALQILNQK